MYITLHIASVEVSENINSKQNTNRCIFWCEYIKMEMQL
jgi:hypothetical protein